VEKGKCSFSSQQESKEQAELFLVQNLMLGKLLRKYIVLDIYRALWELLQQLAL